MRNIIIFFTLIYIPSFCLFADDKLIFAVDVVRHGDRTPIRALDNITYPWKEGLGQLTSKGMAQHLTLGSKLRKRYIDEMKLLPTQYETETLYVRSTDYDRTLMSAQSFLIGLYPIGTGPLEGFQPIPVHSFSKQHDELVPNESSEAEFNRLLEKHVYSSQEWKTKTAQTQSKWSSWTQSTGWKINSLRDVIRLGNTLYIYQLYDVPLPATLSQRDINTLIDYSHRCMALMYQPPEIGQHLGTQPLRIIYDYLQEASQHKTKLKYVLLSAHDSTLLSIMSALGVPLHEAPGYASHLSFELYETSSKHHSVIVRFNDKVIHVQGCDKNQCALPQLKQRTVLTP